MESLSHGAEMVQPFPFLLQAGTGAIPTVGLEVIFNGSKGFQGGIHPLSSIFTHDGAIALFCGIFHHS